MSLKKLTLQILPFLIFVSCASTAQKTEQGNAKTAMEKQTDGQKLNNAVALQARAHNFVEIEFAPGSAQLTESAKTSLDSVIDQARAAGKIDEVLVFSWSDEEFPSKNLKKLPKRQRDLAEDRNDTIKKYVKNGRSLDVDTYSMAEQSNPLSKWFNTTDSKLKNSFTAAGLPTSSDVNQYPSKASRSVILVKVE